MVTRTAAAQGPLLRAAVGDVMEVHLLNNLTFPINIVPGGVVSSAHQAVKVAGPGETVIYAWSVPAEVCRQGGCCHAGNICMCMPSKPRRKHHRICCIC
jgi:hypothetical protein